MVAVASNKIFLILGLLLVLVVSIDATTQQQILSRRRSLMGLLRPHIKDHQDAKIEKHLTPIFPAPSLPAAAKASYNFALDISTFASLSTFQCVYQQGYSAVFIQALTSNGAINSALVQNINNANSAKLGNEIYVTPSTTGNSGASQFDQIFNYLKSSGINVRSIWLQVTSPINWPNNIQTNVNFIQSFVNRATQNGVSPGIFTNWYDWQQITGSYTGFSTARLWYWNAYGQGPNAEAQASFDDYRTFGSWSSPSVKQFALNENLCGLTVNRDVYPLGGKIAAAAAADLHNNNAKEEIGKLTVGGFV